MWSITASKLKMAVSGTIMDCLQGNMPTRKAEWIWSYRVNTINYKMTIEMREENNKQNWVKCRMVTIYGKENQENEENKECVSEASFRKKNHAGPKARKESLVNCFVIILPFGWGNYITASCIYNYKRW